MDTIKLNGLDRPIWETLDLLLVDNGYTQGRIAVLVNGEIIGKESWPACQLVAGDEVDVVGFVGGG